MTRYRHKKEPRQMDQDSRAKCVLSIVVTQDKTCNAAIITITVDPKKAILPGH